MIPEERVQRARQVVRSLRREEGRRFAAEYLLFRLEGGLPPPPISGGQAIRRRLDAILDSPHSEALNSG